MTERLDCRTSPHGAKQLADVIADLSEAGFDEPSRSAYVRRAITNQIATDRKMLRQVKTSVSPASMFRLFAVELQRAGFHSTFRDPRT